VVIDRKDDKLFRNQFPYFQEGNILKQEMLENLRDYPRNFFDIYFQNYSNGIINGINLAVKDDCIFIDQGIVKFNGKIYILDKINKIKCVNSNKELLIKVKFSKSKDEGNFKIHTGEIFLEENINLAQDELELGRFKLREGATLRAIYNQFSDFATEYNTINIINVKYANLNKYTLHPLIVRNFANKLLQESEGDYLDIAFSMSSLNSRIANRDVIINYLSRKLNLVRKDYTNLDIYKYMQRVIKGLSGNGRKKSKVENGPSKIIVD
jgi:hypothetical protein